MTSQDPFGLHDLESTAIIRPRPGGIGPATKRPAADGQALNPVHLSLDIPGESRLLAPLRGLLTLAAELPSRGAPDDAHSLRHHVEREIKAFEEKAYAAGEDPRKVKTANYLICALIDDIVLNTPWGAHGPWPAQTLCGTLHQDVAYGDRFFDLLQDLRQHPEQQRDLLRLIHLCLLLGFEGKYRREAGGRALVGEITNGLGKLLGYYQPVKEPLSPDWEGVAEPYQPLDARVPFWVAAVATLAVLLLVYAGFALHLSTLSEPLKVLIADLPPQGDVQLVRDYSDIEPAAGIAPRFVDQLKHSLDGFLIEDRQNGSVETFEDAQSVTIRLLAEGEDIFGSGKASLNFRYLGLIERIAEALRSQEGKITVSGHSDDRPIRTASFTSNWALSEARARTVASLLGDLMDAPDRIEHVGRADTEPIAPNETPDGRMRNRRIEITVVKQI